MFFVRDGVGPRSSFEVPKPRFSLRAAEGTFLLKLLNQALSRHPFNQQIFLVTAEKPRGFPSSSSSALKQAVAQLAAKSCCFCLRNVTTDAFLSLHVQQLLLKRLQASLLSWRGPASSPACTTAKNAISENQQNSCPVVGDGGGDRNVAALQNDGTLILKVDAFTAQVLGIDTRIRLPHFMRRILPPGTQYLKLNVQHPAVLRHQQKQQKQGKELKQQPSDHAYLMSLSSSSSCYFPPSRLYEQMQRSLHSLEPMDFLATATPPQAQGENNLEKRLALAHELQTLLRASGSTTASCHLVQLECRLSVYRGGAVNMTDETAMAFNAFDAELTEELTERSSIMLTPNFLASFRPQLLLPDWAKLFTLATFAAPQPQPRMTNYGETRATVVVRRRNRRRTRGGESQEKQVGGSIRDKGGNNVDDKLQTNERSALPADSQRHFPPLHPPYLGGLQLLHERQRQARSERTSNRKKQLQPAGESTEEHGPNPEVLQLTAPPPFIKLPPAEALFSSVTEYLGCVAMDIPTDKVSLLKWRSSVCLWILQIHVASVSGGLAHSTAVVAAAESLCRWLQAEGQGAWAGISVVGTAETSVVYTNQPHDCTHERQFANLKLITFETNLRVSSLFVEKVNTQFSSQPDIQ
ncbi:hypothetical protein Esti_006378 [Eimeria stiedai]